MEHFVTLEALETRRLFALQRLHDDPDSSPGVGIGNTLLFVAEEFETGAELWKTDGTPQGTMLLKDIRPGFEGSGDELPGDGLEVENSGPLGFFASGGVAYFSANDGVSGIELWRTDGTTEGTFLIKDINPGPADSFPQSFIEFKRRVFFVAFERPNDFITSLWTSDGTVAGTFRISDVVELPVLGILGRNTLRPVLLFQKGRGEGIEIWRTDGTISGTVQIDTISARFLRDSVEISNAVLFTAKTDETGTELWRSDGTVGGTRLLKDIRPGEEDSWPSHLESIDDVVYFQADDGIHGPELWRSDGTEDGTVLWDLEAGPDGSYPGWFTEYDGRIFFSASVELGGELWKTDGTLAGTTMAVDVIPGEEGSYPHLLEVLKDRLVFSGGFGGGWISDGTSTGTKQLEDLFDEFTLSPYFSGVEFHDSIYFDSPEGMHRLTAWPGFAVGNIYNDADGNGLREQEPGLKGFRVFADLDNDGICDKNEPSTRSSVTGRFRLNLDPGTYWLRITPVENWRNTTSMRVKVTIEATTDTVRHFGVTRNLFVSGTVYMDANVNGGKDEREPGLPGWRVFVDLDLDGVWDSDELSTLTDASGRYSFSSLAGGTYAIRVVQQAGYKRTAPQSGIRWVSASPGQVVTKLNFGEKRIA